MLRSTLIFFLSTILLLAGSPINATTKHSNNPQARVPQTKHLAYCKISPKCFATRHTTKSTSQQHPIHKKSTWRKAFLRFFLFLLCCGAWNTALDAVDLTIPNTGEMLFPSQNYSWLQIGAEHLNDSTGMCGGFVTALPTGESVIFTDAHCLPWSVVNHTPILACPPDSMTNSSCFFTELIAINPILDAALLHPIIAPGNKNPLTDYKALSFAKQAPKKGDGIVCYGFAHATKNGLLRHEGVFLRAAPLSWTHHIIKTALPSIQHGHCGSPCLDKDGNVVGAIELTLGYIVGLLPGAGLRSFVESATLPRDQNQTLSLRAIPHAYLHMMASCMIGVKLYLYGKLLKSLGVLVKRRLCNPQINILKSIRNRDERWQIIKHYLFDVAQDIKISFRPFFLAASKKA